MAGESLFDLTKATRDPRTVRFKSLIRIASNRGLGTKPPNLYLTWIHYRLSNALSPWILVLLALTLAHFSRARRSNAFLFFAAVALGFVYFIVQQTALALGEAGLAPPFMAAWLPQSLILIFLVDGSVRTRHLL